MACKIFISRDDIDPPKKSCMPVTIYVYGNLSPYRMISRKTPQSTPPRGKGYHAMTKGFPDNKIRHLSDVKYTLTVYFIIEQRRY